MREPMEHVLDEVVYVLQQRMTRECAVTLIIQH